MVELIVTNNPLFKERNRSGEALFVDGTYRDVLIKVRDLIYSGYILVSHPLSASSRMHFSPYRSILVTKIEGTHEVDENSCLCIGEAIETYDRIRHKTRSTQDEEGYMVMDAELLYATAKEG